MALLQTVHAGTYNNDFSSPDNSRLTLVGGQRANGSPYPVIENGYLALTFAENSLTGSAYLEDLDPGASIGSLTADFKVRVGGGSSTPADGWSMVFASDLLTDTAFGEEGPDLLTGLTVSFDNFDNGGLEAPAIDVKWNGEVIAHRSVDVFDMLSDTFVPVSIRVNSNGFLDLTYRGNVIYQNLWIPGFSPLMGARFAWGARTGGLNANHWVDDIAVTTTAAGPAAAPTIPTGPASQTVAEHGSVTFSAVPQGSPPFTFQWLRNNEEIPGANGPTYSISPVSFNDNGARFSVLVVNAHGNRTSDQATLTVQQDTIRPTIVSAASTATFDRVIVDFSEAVTAASAGAVGNYGISGGVTVNSVDVISSTRVVLNTTRLAPGTSYTLTVNGVEDLAATPNQIVANSQATFNSFVESRGFLRFEQWTGIDGNPVDNLLNHPHYQNDPPDFAGYVNSFNSRVLFPDDSREAYGARFTGFITPSVSGDYRFFISSDDGSRLYLSTDADPLNLVAIAVEGGCCQPFLEPPASQTSGPIPLEAGQRYFIMYAYKEGVGGDYGRVGWRLEGDTTLASALPAIPGTFLSTYADPAGATLNFTAQPESRTAAANTRTTFSVGVTGSYTPLFIQWQRADQGSEVWRDIPGANSATYQTPVLNQAADNGSRYRVFASVPGLSGLSSEATLTVNIDSILPTVTSASPGLNMKSVTLQFSEAMSEGTLGQNGNYTIPGLQVTAATVINPTTVRLTTSPQAQNTSYTLTVSQVVQDSAGNSMDPAGASIAFRSLVVVPGAIREDFYTGIGGTAVAELLNHPTYPSQPAGTTVLPGFDAINGYGDNYGAALRGFVTPTVTGDYRFFVRSDDASQLFISTDDDPANLSAQPIAFENGCCQGFLEPPATQTSEPIHLEAGQSYYILFVFKEGGGGDWAQLAWRDELDGTLAGSLLPIGRQFVHTAVPIEAINALALPIEERSPIGSGQTPGFTARIYQVNQEGATVTANQISRAEQELAGLIGPNVADLSQAVEGLFPITTFINWTGDAGEAGNFQTGSDPSRPDSPIPGIPGLGSNTGRNTDNIAGEIITYVQFPNAGLYFLGVNSDDGFNVTATDEPPIHNRAVVATSASGTSRYYAVGSGTDEGGVFAPITGPVSGRLVLAEPIAACSALTNPDAIRGNIAVIERGVCAFSLKVQAALNAGAIGVIMINSRDPGSADGIWPIVMGGSFVNLPAVMISKPDGNLLKAAIQAGEVMGSITPDPTRSYGRFNGGRGASDTIFPVQVPEAGVYPIRTVWFEGEGGANIEIFSVTAAGVKTLVNDTENQDALRAFRARAFTPPTPQLSITWLNAGEVQISWTGSGTLESSPTVRSGYTPTASQSNPQTVSVTTGTQFYRVVRR